MNERVTRLVIIERPDFLAAGEEFLTVAQVRARLHLDTAEDDSFLESLIKAAAETLDPSADGWFGHALRPQTWEVRLDAFPCWSRHNRYSEIRLPYPPLNSVVSVKYDDSDGVEQTLVENTDYKVLGIDSNGMGSIVPMPETVWPSARSEPDSVRVRFTCGYGFTNASPPVDLLPEKIKNAAMMMIGHWLENREASAPIDLKSIPMGVHYLLNPMRLGWL